MAGPLAIIPASQPSSSVVEKPPTDSSSAVNGNNSWQVQFSRFVILPTSPLSTSPFLIPLPKKCRSRPKPGVWISSRSATVSLQLIHNLSGSDPVLSVLFCDTILEEHYVCRLHFSWPQVSCVSGFPARGSRVVIVSYRDSFGVIQKFALRFSTASVAEMFINSLKGIFKDPTEEEPLPSLFRSEISLPSAFMSSTGRSPSRTGIDDLSPYSSQLALSSEYVPEQVSCTKETKVNREHKIISAALPPSFMSLLANCRSEVNQTVTDLPEEDLKSQIAKYMDDSSFQDLLMKVENVIKEIGDDIFL